MGNYSPNDLTLSAKSRGNVGEDLAAGFLQGKGYEIMQRNFFVRGGEIDIIAKKNGILVFVEVKTRWTQKFGAAADSLTSAKKRKLRRAIAIYLGTQQATCGIRADLISIQFTSARNIITGALEAQIKHHQNIFED